MLMSLCILNLLWLVEVVVDVVVKVVVVYLEIVMVVRCVVVGLLVLIVVYVLVEVVVDVSHGFVRNVGSGNIDFVSFSFLMLFQQILI